MSTDFYQITWTKLSEQLNYFAPLKYHARFSMKKYKDGCHQEVRERDTYAKR